MAHPYSSTPLYTGTPSYTAQQAYYPPFQPNVQQQPIHTPPGMPSQPPQPHPAYQPSPGTNVARFDTNSQIRPLAPAFPQFPPPATFSPDFFKQFTNAGLPLPPPPSFPPVPLPTTGYPQLPATVNPSVSSPYPQHFAPSAQGFGSGFAPNEQMRQNLPDPFMGSQSGGVRGGRDGLSESQSYNTSASVHGGTSHTAPAASKSVDLGPDPVMPSFGSKSDIDLLFASVQQQIVPPLIEQTLGAAEPKAKNARNHTDHATEGNISPYDPSRPAAFHDGTFGGFAGSKPLKSKPVERVYDNKSLPELRQLAKGALLSLVPHKILYADLVKEGIHSQVLQELYDELGLKTDLNQNIPQELPNPQQSRGDGIPSSIPLETSNLGRQGPQLGAPSSPALPEQPYVLPPSTGPSPDGAASQSEAAPPLAANIIRQQPAPSPNLERKDRIAQLLAAKTGRPNSTPATASSPAQKDESALEAQAGQSSNTNNIHVPDSASKFPETQSENSTAVQASGSSRPKTQTELVKQKMEQLKREAQARKQTPVQQNAQLDPTALTGKQQMSHLQSTSQQGSSPIVSTSTIKSFSSLPAAISTIPGLFMTSAEYSRSGEIEVSASGAPRVQTAADTEMSGMSDAAAAIVESLHPDPLPATILSRKRPSDPDSMTAEFQPPSKKSNMQGSIEQSRSVPDEDTYQSEGEILEEPESDDMAIGSDSEPQDYQEEYEKPEEIIASAASIVDKAEISKPSSTTPLQDGSANELGDELYRAKQSEIEEMRKRIAQLEQQKELKRTRSQPESPVASNVSTPAVSKEGPQLSSSPAPQPPVQSSMSGSSPQLQRQALGPRTISKLTPAQLAERAANLKADLLRQRAQRQQVLQNGLPDLNAEVKKMEARLETSRNELVRVRIAIERHRAELERSTKLENDLLEEVAQLEKQLQEGRSGQKQYSEELAQIKLEKLAESQAVSVQEESGPPTSVEQPAAPTAVPSSLPGLDSTGVEEDPISTTLDAPNERIVPIPQQEPTLPAEPLPGTESGATTNGQAAEIESTDKAVESEGIDEAALPLDPMQTDEMEISPGPEASPETPAALQPTSDRMDSSNESVEMDDDNSDGSASMSDSGSDDEEEEYEPADAEASQPSQEYDGQSDEYDPEEAPVESVTPTTGAEDENEALYRPPEAIDATEPALPHVDAVTPLEGSAVSEVPADTHDDLETAPQLTEADTLVKTQPAANGDDTDDKPFLDGTSPPATHFVPYKTPLSAFKTFRFHSEFNDTVKSGYRSLTYSNNINPTRPLCPTELSGDACTDPNCEEQHFSQIGLPDDKILVQMSSASDIKDKDVRDQFLAGLKQVIANLRAKEVKEFESVADALSIYRRQFYADRENAEAE